MPKIMVVEDDQSLREIYSIRLTAEGFELVSAGDGEEALAVAVKEKPDLIISDVMMPKISGFDMLDILRSTPETKNIKVIMMTALSSEDQRKRGENLGADKYLVKSQVGIEDVIAAVKEVLGIQPQAATQQTQVNDNRGTEMNNPNMPINNESAGTEAEATVGAAAGIGAAALAQAGALAEQAGVAAGQAVQGAVENAGAAVANTVPNVTGQVSEAASVAGATVQEAVSGAINNVAQNAASAAVPGLVVGTSENAGAPSGAEVTPESIVAAAPAGMEQAAPEVMSSKSVVLPNGVSGVANVETISPSVTPVAETQAQGVDVNNAAGTAGVAAAAPAESAPTAAEVVDTSPLDAMADELAHTAVDALDNTAGASAEVPGAGGTEAGTGVGA